MLIALLSDLLYEIKKGVSVIRVGAMGMVSVSTTRSLPLQPAAEGLWSLEAISPVALFTQHGWTTVYVLLYMMIK